MSDQAVRQRYKIATGGGLDKAPPKTSNPGFARGGKAKAKPAPKNPGKKR